MTTLIIERKGGLAGLGLPGSRVRSRGRVEWESLTSEERAAVDKLFAQRAARGNQRPAARDEFIYVLTRPAGAANESVEVGEMSVPPVLRQSIKDELI